MIKSFIVMKLNGPRHPLLCFFTLKKRANKNTNAEKCHAGNEIEMAEGLKGEEKYIPGNVF
jgi:hypothetical protein